MTVVWDSPGHLLTGVALPAGVLLCNPPRVEAGESVAAECE